MVKRIPIMGAMLMLLFLHNASFGQSGDDPNFCIEGWRTTERGTQIGDCTVIQTTDYCGSTGISFCSETSYCRSGGENFILEGPC